MSARTINRLMRAAGGVVLCSLGSVAVMAQTMSDRPYLMQTMPYPVYHVPEPVDYNLKWGQAIARLDANVQFEFNDNINLSDQGKLADISIAPNLNIGFILPTSKEHVLQLDLGAGYRWYLNNPSVNNVTLAPRSKIEYRIFVGELQFSVYDQFSIQTDPMSRVELGGQSDQAMQFSQFINSVGIMGEWRPLRQWGLMMGYDYGLVRDLTSDFPYLDNDSHSISAGLFFMPNSKFTLGLNSGISFYDFRTDDQNDGGSWSAGPFMRWEMTQFVSLDASVGYSESFYTQQASMVQDDSNFSGITFQVGMRHRMNSSTSQTLTVGRSLSTGFLSNFSEIWGVQHMLMWKMTRTISLNSTFSYTHYLSSTTSYGSSSGDRYLWSLGTSFQVSRRWTVGLGYSIGWKDADQYTGLLAASNASTGGYVQNRITINVSRKF